MKKMILMLTLLMSLTMTSCMTTYSTKKIDKVEIGMDKSDIKKLLGTPRYKRANESGEQWGYEKEVGKVEDPERVTFVVTFNTSGKVVEYETLNGPHFHRTF